MTDRKPSASRVRVLCRYCGRAGHTERACPTKRNTATKPALRKRRTK
jgi:hypothetical protein